MSHIELVEGSASASHRKYTQEVHAEIQQCQLEQAWLQLCITRGWACGNVVLRTNKGSVYRP